MSYIVVNVTMSVALSVHCLMVSVVTRDVLRGVSRAMFISVLSGSDCDDSIETKYLKYGISIIINIHLKNK